MPVNLFTAARQTSALRHRLLSIPVLWVCFSRRIHPRPNRSAPRRQGQPAQKRGFAAATRTARPLRATCVLSIDLRYRLRGELHIYGRQRIVEIPNTDGTTTELERFGRFVSAFGEKDFWLEVYRSPQTGETEIFFKDLTNGHTTYGGGRYARLTREDDGMYVIDFNNAYNPYCAYNPIYICPLPPRQNYLEFAIEAGELMGDAAPP